MSELPRHPDLLASDSVSRAEYEALLAHHIKLKAQSDAAHVGLAILAKKMGISVADWKAMIAPVHEETLHHSWALLEDMDPGTAARLDTRIPESDLSNEKS
ncbi:MAG: hypothetical protein JWO08_2407 [Verrucomicrobiaceae bacterium]|nr:hypothetical protein [Verrucomicrobiaceae bacterium]